MKRLLLAAVLLFSTPPTLAQAGDVKAHPLGTLLSAVALNGAAATRTFTVGPALTNGTRLYNYSILTLRVAYTWANNGTLTVTCTEGDTVATATATPTTCTVASGTCTLNYAGVFVTPSLTASKTFKIDMGLTGSQALSCVVAHGGVPNANDKVTVSGVLLGEGA